MDADVYYIIWYGRPILLINLLVKRLNLFPSFSGPGDDIPYKGRRDVGYPTWDGMGSKPG